MFALYSAWYFWVPKIIGLFYNQPMSKSHFWILFLGVNLTFFPQHFLGLQGMPRRISDYADAFAGWNMVSSLGSIVSVIATYVFLHLVYVQLRNDLFVIRNPWILPDFYTDLLRVINNKVSTSLEWVLTNPPKPHAFISLPLQSSIWSIFAKKNWKNLIVRTLIIFFTGLALRSFILYVFEINVFLHPFTTISLVYYAFMAIYTVIHCELYPAQVAVEVAKPLTAQVPINVTMEEPMPMPMTMAQGTNTGVLAMNSKEGATDSNIADATGFTAGTSTNTADTTDTTPTADVTHTSDDAGFIAGSTADTTTASTTDPIPTTRVTGNTLIGAEMPTTKPADLVGIGSYRVNDRLCIKFETADGQTISITGAQLHRALNDRDDNGLNLNGAMAYDLATPFVEPEVEGSNNTAEAGTADTADTTADTTASTTGTSTNTTDTTDTTDITATSDTTDGTGTTR